MTQQVLSNQETWLTHDVVEPGIEDRIAYSTPSGVLYQGDIAELLPYVRNDSIDTVFADPPFNLSKVYGTRVNDNRSDGDYISWCKEWLDQCVRVVRPG